MNNGKFHSYRGIFLVFTSFVLFWVTKSFIKPVAVGAIFAVVLQPVMDWLGRWKLPTALRAALATILFSVSFLIPFAVLIIVGADAALAKIQSMTAPAGGAGGMEFTAIGVMEVVQPWLDRLAAITPLSEEQIRTLLTRGIQSAGMLTARLLQAIIAGLPLVFISTFVILIALFFFLIDGRRVVEFMKHNSFFSIAETTRILQATAALCRSVILATIVSGFVQGALLAIACMIAGVANPFVVALVTFVASFLPVIGTAPITIGLTVYGYATGSFFAGTVFLVFVVIVGLSDNFVRPYVLKGGGELHPLVGFVAAFGALEALGFYGLFIGPVVAGFFFAILPVVAKSYEGYSESRRARLRTMR